MREVAKSILGFSWAVSLFTVQQAARLMTPSATVPAEATAKEFDEVSRAVQSHFSDPVAKQFHAGDEWQRKMVDALFDAASMQSLDPRPLVKTGADLVQRSVDAMRQMASSAPPDVPAVL